MTKPFSYIVPVSNFGSIEEVWDDNGKVLAKISDRPINLGVQDDPSRARIRRRLRAAGGGGGRGGANQTGKREARVARRTARASRISSRNRLRPARGGGRDGRAGRGDGRGRGAGGRRRAGAAARARRRRRRSARIASMQWLPPFDDGQHAS